MTATDTEIAQTILRLCTERGSGKTIRTSEAARAVSSADWRAQMPVVRSCVAALVREGRIEMFQRGWPVYPATVKGAIRLGLPNRDDQE